jgi:hypothetical protein
MSFEKELWVFLCNGFYPKVAMASLNRSEAVTSYEVVNHPTVRRYIFFEA